MAQFAIDEVLTTGIQISGFIFDYSNRLGTAGQVLTSTTSGVMWQADSSIVDLSSLSGLIAATGTTLNNKINSLSGYVNNTFLSGSGTQYYVPRWNTSKQLVTGNIYDNGNVGIGTASPNTKLRVNGSFSHRPSGSSSIQEYKNIVTYNLDNYGDGGYVVKTPFLLGSSYEMAIVHVKGYGYGNASLYDFKVVFYDYGPSSAPVGYSLIDLGNDGSPKYLAKDANNYVQVCFGNTTDTSRYYHRFTVDCTTTRNDNDYSQGWGMYQTTGTNFGFASTGVYPLSSPINFNVATNYVGIGKTNPACQLDVVGTIRSSTNQIYGFGANDSVSLRANSSLNVLGIYTSNVERLRVDANGYLGIGLAPSTLLSVGGVGSTSAASGLTFGGDASANLYRISSSRIKTDGSLEVAIGIISPTITSLSGNIAATGSTLDTKINALSGYSNANFATILNLAATGSTLDTKINTLSGYSNANFATILNLAATGSTLDTKINTLSGYSNANFATILNLAATGSTLDTKINTTNTNLAATGSTLDTKINATNTNLAATGSTLDTKINTLSGYSNANFATILNLAATGSTLDTKINTTNTNLAATGSTLDTKINATNTNLAATGSTLDTKINATNTNLAATGSTLDTKINTTNTNLAATGSTLDTKINTTNTNLAATGSTLNARINSLSGYAGSTFLSGQGVANWTARWNGTKELITGSIYDLGTGVGIGTVSPSERLQIVGNLSVTDNDRFNFKARRIPLEGNPQGGAYKGYLILAKAFLSGLVEASYVIGKVILRRGTSSSGHLVDVYEIDSSRGYNSEMFQVHKLSGFASRFSRLVKVTYGGNVYHAIETLSTGGVPTTEMYFEGAIVDSPLIFTDETFVSGVSAYGSVGIMVDDSTNVGIGTSAPAAKLDIAGTTNFQSDTFSLGVDVHYDKSFAYFYGRTGYANRGNILFNNGTAQNLVFGEIAPNIYSFGPGSSGAAPTSNTLTLDNLNTRVGIGTTAPNHALHLSTISNDVSIGLYTTNANTSARNWIINANELAYGDFSLKQSNAISGNPRTTGTIRFYIKNDGNVGIGTTNPSSNLTIYDHANGATLNLVGRGSDDTAVINFRSSGDLSTYAYLAPDTNEFRTYHNDGFMSFYPGGSEKLRITAAGNVGIGVTNPGARLQVVNTGSITSTSTVRIVGATGNGGGSQIEFFKGTSQKFSIGTASAITGGFSDDLLITTLNPSSIILTAGLSGLAVFKTDGKVGIGMYNPTTLLSVGSAGSTTAASGITFGADAQVNLYRSAENVLKTDGSLIITDSLGLGLSPTQKLQVDGAVGNPALNGTTQSGIFRISNTTDNATLDIGIRAAGSGAWLQSTDETSLSAYYSLLLNPNGGNVGIGTTAPAEKLDVRGGAIANGNGTIKTALSYTTEGLVGTLSNHALLLFTNNTEKVRITSAGNVGIGTDSPTQKLQVSGTVKIQSLGVYSDPTDNAAFLNYDTNGGIFTLSARSNGGNTYMAFRTSNGGTGSEKVRITNDGRVGISSNAPTDFLDFGGAGKNIVFGYAAYGEVLNSAASIIGNNVKASPTANSQVRRFASTTDQGNFIKLIFNKGVTFHTNITSVLNTDISEDTNERMRIDLSGNVGIGTITPNAKIHVLAADAATADLARFQQTSQGNLLIQSQQGNQSLGGSNGILFSNAVGRIGFRTNTSIGDAQVVINANGNVGINTTNPSSRLYIIQNSANNALSLDSDSSSIYSTLEFNVSGVLKGQVFADSSNDSLFIRTNTSTGALRFGTANSERMRIDTSGNVGINTTNPISKFVVNGGNVNTVTYTTSEARIADGSLHLMKTVAGGIFESIRAMNMDTTAGTTVRVLAASTSDPFNNANGGKVFIDAIRTATNMDLAFSLNDVAGAAAVERVRFMGGGKVGIGTASPTTLLSVGGVGSTSAASGITFGADAEANLYRSAEDTIKTDGSLIVAGNVTATNLVSGNGTANFITKWNGTKSIANSQIFDDGTYVGVNTAVNTTYRLQVNGSFAATTKSFDITHPTISGKRLVYASLEGPENGVYLRGRNDNNEVNLPHYWSGLVHDDSITVGLTSIGKRKDGKIRNYSVDQIGYNKVYIYTDSDDNIYDYYYTIFAERKDVSKLVVERDME